MSKAQKESSRTSLDMDIRNAARVQTMAADPEGRELERLAKIEQVSREPIYLLFYDIPDSVKIPNPSYRLWPLGWRKQLSCWGVPQRSVEDARMTELMEMWDEVGVTYDLMRQHDSEREKFHRQAVEKLEEFTRWSHGSLLKRLDDASMRYITARQSLEEQVRLKTEVSSREWEKLESRRISNMRAVLTECSTHLSGVISCAELFDESGVVDDLVKAFNHTLRLEVAAHNAEMEEIKAKKWLFVELPKNV